MSAGKGSAALGALMAVLCLAVSLGSTESTYAAFSDYANTPGRFGAGVWTPDPPAACGRVSSYWGTAGDDVIRGGNHPQIIMGLGGDDVIHGGNSGDCLVGGTGEDRLVGGNAKDILIGGPGDDYLSGGNAKDNLDGSEDLDVCDGGNGKDTVVNCEYGSESEASADVPETVPLSPAVTIPGPSGTTNSGAPRGTHSGTTDRPPTPVDPTPVGPDVPTITLSDPAPLAPPASAAPTEPAPQNGPTTQAALPAVPGQD